MSNETKEGLFGFGVLCLLLFCVIGIPFIITRNDENRDRYLQRVNSEYAQNATALYLARQQVNRLEKRCDFLNQQEHINQNLRNAQQDYLADVQNP